MKELSHRRNLRVYRREGISQMKKKAEKKSILRKGGGVGGKRNYVAVEPVDWEL